MIWLNDDKFPWYNTKFVFESEKFMECTIARWVIKEKLTHLKGNNHSLTKDY